MEMNNNYKKSVMAFLKRLEAVYGSPKWYDNDEDYKTNVRAFERALININQSGMDYIFDECVIKHKFFPKPSEVNTLRPEGDRYKIKSNKPEQKTKEAKTSPEWLYAQDWASRWIEENPNKVYESKRYAAYLTGSRGWEWVNMMAEGWGESLLALVVHRKLESKLTFLLENKNFDDFKKYLIDFDVENPSQFKYTGGK